MNQIPSYPQIAGLAAQIALAFGQSDAIRETDGNNRSPEIDKIERVYGDQGVSYCVEGALFCRFKGICFLLWLGQPIDDDMLRRAKTFHEQHYGPALTGCTDMIAAYGRLHRWRALDHSQVQTWIKQVKAGDGIIYDFSTPGHFDRHFETFIKMQTNADGSLFKNEDGHYVMVTVGFNTSPDAGSDDQGDGQGCYVRHRAINNTVMGSIDWNSQTV